VDPGVVELVAVVEPLPVPVGVHDVSVAAIEDEAKPACGESADEREARFRRVDVLVQLDYHAGTDSARRPHEAEVGRQGRDGPPLQQQDLRSSAAQETHSPGEARQKSPVDAVEGGCKFRRRNLGEGAPDACATWVEGLRHELSHQDDRHVTVSGQGA